MPTTHDVPGGTITLRTMAELTPRQKRRIRPYVLALSGPLEQMGAATEVYVDGALADSSTVLKGASVRLDLAQANLFTDMQDETTVALLEAWSFPVPLPTTIDQLLDVDDTTGHRGVYDSISGWVAKSAADAMVNGFEITRATLADESSPTGA